jgi:hypothetical protein
MNFPPPRVGCDSGRATPSLRHTPHAAKHNPRETTERHLSFAETCSDKPRQRYPRTASCSNRRGGIAFKRRRPFPEFEQRTGHPAHAIGTP